MTNIWCSINKTVQFAFAKKTEITRSPCIQPNNPLQFTNNSKLTPNSPLGKGKNSPYPFLLLQSLLGEKNQTWLKVNNNSCPAYYYSITIKVSNSKQRLLAYRIRAITISIEDFIEFYTKLQLTEQVKHCGSEFSLFSENHKPLSSLQRCQLRNLTQHRVREPDPHEKGHVVLKPSS